MAVFADRYLRFPEYGGRPSGFGDSMLWPVHVWRVLYPEPSRKSLNIFQQAILGLARARTTDRDEVGALLGLAPELVAFIVATQLIPQGVMDGRGCITTKGLNVLNTLEFEKAKQLVGYAFQDAITGELLPRFSSSLPEIEPCGEKGGFPVFLLDRGKGETDCPYSVPAVATARARLSEKQFFDAYERYRRDYDNSRAMSDEDLVTAERVKIQGIELIDENPVPMYLWTWLYKEKGGEKPWLVSDPFGLRRAAPWMRERVRNLAPKLPPLAKKLARVLGADPALEITLETLDEMEEKVMWEVLSNYPWAPRVPSLARYLPSFLRARNLVAMRERPSEEQLDTLVSEAQKLGEGTFKWMMGQGPVFSRHRLPKYDSWKRDEAMATFMSLDLPMVNSAVADGLAGQQLYNIKKARNTGNESLKALLAAALLSSSEHVDFPLNQVEVGSGDLQRLIELANVRNKAQHASGRRLLKEEALSQSDFIMEWVQKFKELY